MMAEIDFITSIAQLPNLQGLAGAAQAQPEAQQIFAAQMAQEALKEQTHQVQKVEKDEGSEAIKDDQERRRGADQELQHRKREAKPDASEESDNPPASASPWLGHLINKKV